MLPPEHRLRRRRDFTTAVRQGRRAGGPLLVIHAGQRSDSSGASHADSSATLIGFVLPKAVGGAVTRNLVRRRLQHLLRERLPRIAPGRLVVVRVLPPAATASFEELGVALDRGLERLGLLDPVAS